MTSDDKISRCQDPCDEIPIDDLPASPDTRCNFAGSNSLANHFLESRERLFAGSEFRVQARGRVSVCLRVLSQFLRPQKHVKYV